MGRLYDCGLYVSEGSSKLENINSLNTNCLISDYCNSRFKALIKKHKLTINNLDEKLPDIVKRNQGHVCLSCYAMYALLTFRKNKMPEIFTRNSELLSSKIITDIPKINAYYFRFNSFGEIINSTHFINLCNIARNNPGNFSLYTKRANIVKKHLDIIPDNLILIYSSNYINKPEVRPDGFHKTFTVYSPEYIRKSGIKINCPGKCFDCKLCYKKSGAKEIKELVKSYVRSRTIFKHFLPTVS